MNDRTLISIHADMLRSRMEKISARLRDMADAVDRHAADIDRVPTPGRASYGSVVASVQHEVLWGVANLSLDGLTSAAADAHRSDEG